MDLLIFPCGGNALEALDCLNEQTNMIGFIDDNLEKIGQKYYDFEVFSRNEYKKILEKYNNIQVLICLGNPTNFRKRKEIIENFCKDLSIEKERLATVIHSSAKISKYASIGSNCLIMAGVVIIHNAKIGDNVIILPNTVIHHDTQIGDYTCIGSNVVVAGFTTIGESCYIGSGSNIINNIEIGTKTIIGMGTNVIKSIGENKKIVGNPAREILNNN
jgi:sugar O-acyltransferase (sialic acid O-acetyltransferase NeuD family)